MALFFTNGRLPPTSKESLEKYMNLVLKVRGYKVVIVIMKKERQQEKNKAYRYRVERATLKRCKQIRELMFS